MTVTTARRTMIRPGRELDYERTHAQVPSAVYDALLSSGVVSWRIWRDGRLLFHAIETVGSMADMQKAMAIRMPVDAEWDEIIADLLEPSATGPTMLPLVWRMDADGQSSDSE